MGHCTVREVMTTDVVYACEDTPFRDLVGLFEGNRVSAVPVIDAYNFVVGVVSESDLLPKMEFAGVGRPARLFTGRRNRAARAKSAGEVAAELMTTPAVTVTPHTSVAAAVRIMSNADVHQLPVVDLAGKLVGIVSRGDLLDVFLRPDQEIADDVRHDLGGVPDLRGAAVAVAVAAGTVTLTGAVPRRSVAGIAGRVAQRVDGVVTVVNQLTYAQDDVSPAVVDIP